MDGVLDNQPAGYEGDLDPNSEELVDESSSRFPVGPPTVFISYRRTDTGRLVAKLVDNLRVDLGHGSVFHDRDSIRPGDDWRPAIEDAIDGSDIATFVIGDKWENGLEKESDNVRLEILRAMSDETDCHAQPLVIDRGVPKLDPDLYSDVAPKVTSMLAAQAILASREQILRKSSEEYQAVLLTAWDALRRKRPNGIMIIGEPGNTAPLAQVVAAMHDEPTAVVETSEFLSGCYFAWLRDSVEMADQPTYFIHVGSGKPSTVMEARIRAASLYLGGAGAIALIGAGAHAVASSLGSSGTGGATFSVHSSAASMTTQNSGVLSVLTSKAAGATVAQKALAGLAGLSILGGSVVAGQAIFDRPSLAIEFSSSSDLESNARDENPEFFPFGLPPEAKVSLGDPEPTGDEMTLETGEAIPFESREVTVSIGDDIIDLDLGSVVLPQSLPPGGVGDEAETIALDLVSTSFSLADPPSFTPEDICTDRVDPSVLVGGQEFVPGEYTVTVLFSVNTAEGAVESTDLQVELAGPVQLRSIVDLTDRDVSDCRLAVADVLWGG